MKKIALLLTVIMLLSCTGCYEGGRKTGIDLNNDGNDDIAIMKPEPVVYTVSFQTNGGTYVAPKKIVNLESAPHTTQEGYEFRGWYRDSNCTVPVIYPLSIDQNMTLYAKWLRVGATVNCADISLSFLVTTTFSIDPSFLDLYTLAQEGYRVNITVKYRVRYEKDYDVLWDIGYLGAPKYEAFIYNSKNKGVLKKNLTTTLSPVPRTISYEAYASELINEDISLGFFTDNVQNIVHVEGITIQYDCYK